MVRSAYSILVIAIQVASAFRVDAVRQQVAPKNIGTQIAGNSTLKEVLFFRHAMSIGNWASAHWWSAVKTYKAGLPQAIADGELHAFGEKQIVDRMKVLKDEDIERIVNAEIILVSPLKRAIATAIIILSEAYKKQGIVPDETYTWPEVRVVSTLREKVGSVAGVTSTSDVPGTGGDTFTYIEKITKKYSKTVGEYATWKPFARAVRDSYQTAEDDSSRWKSPSPTTEMQLVHMIKDFKHETLSKLDQTKILAIGHGTWSRTAFSAFMPNGYPAEAEHADTQKNNAISGHRVTMKLNNVGMLRANFDPAEKIFRTAVVDPIHPGTRDLPNCAFKKHKHSRGGAQDPGKVQYKKVTLNSLEEAELMEVVPVNSAFENFEVKYQKGISGLWPTRMITLSTTADGVNFAWEGGDNGDESKHMAIVKVKGTDMYSFDVIPAYVSTSSNERKVVFHDPAEVQRDISIKLEEGADFDKFHSKLMEFAEKATEVSYNA